MHKKNSSNRGFTLIEILIVIGMLAILATVVLVAINPLRQFAQARNSQRQANVSAILNAVGNRIADNGGMFENGSTCTAVIGEQQEVMTGAPGRGVMEGFIDIRPCLVPMYLSEMPADPLNGGIMCSTDACDAEGDSYNTGYFISRDPVASRITVCAPAAAEPAIPGSEPFCLTR